MRARGGTYARPGARGAAVAPAEPPPAPALVLDQIDREELARSCASKGRYPSEVDAKRKADRGGGKKPKKAKAPAPMPVATSRGPSKGFPFAPSKPK